MKCEICGNEAMENSVVCSDKCQQVRLKRFEILNKYTPTHGCDNCWGDLHVGCSSKCQEEFRIMGELSKDLWGLIHLITEKDTKKFGR